MLKEDGQHLLRDAVEHILEPLARLAVAQGLPFAQAEELFKRAYVRAARDARQQAGANTTRDVSGVSVATGINRREVARISEDLQPPAVQRPSAATQVFSRWISDRRLRGRDGKPRELPRNRTGRGHSFESLSQSVTRHVHPRSLLDELCRLGLAEVSEDGATVRLLRDHFVPQQDDKRLFGFLSSNVSDHLAAATANVLHRDRRHFEQALFTDELSEQSAHALRDMAQAQWSALLAAVLPELERLIAQDQSQGRPLTHRARLGLFTYHEPVPEAPDETSE